MKFFFTNDKFFAFTTWFAVLAIIPYVLVVSLLYTDQFIIFENCIRLINVLCLAVTYISYKKHNKNVMKGMMGAVMITLVLIGLTSFFINENYKIESGISIALAIALFINHFIINSDRQARPANVLINQILVLVLAIVAIVSFVSLVPTCINTADAIVTILAAFGQPFSMISIICIEARLDAYRSNREEAGWTEEKGYPKNYVHEFEKEENN